MPLLTFLTELRYLGVDIAELSILTPTVPYCTSAQVGNFRSTGSGKTTKTNWWAKSGKTLCRLQGTVRKCAKIDGTVAIGPGTILENMLFGV